MPFLPFARRYGLPLLVAVVSALVAASIARAQGAPRQAVYLVLKGNDTLVIERVRRTASGVRATIASPGQPSIEIDYTLAPDHSMPSLSLIVRGANAAADATPLQTGSARFAGDSVFLDLRAGGQSRTRKFATRAGALPITNNDFVIYEQFARIAKARGVRTLTLPVFAMAGGVTLDATLELLGADTARFTVAGNVTLATLDADGNVTAGALPAQGMRIVVLTGTAADAVKLGKPDYSAPAGAPYTATDVVVRTPAGHALSGTLTVPVGATGPVPAVVTITGSGAQDRDEYIPLAGGLRIFRQVADTLSRRGIAVLRLDDRGVGGSGGDVNGTSADFADDIRAAIAFLRARTEIDPSRIALVGHSEGGMIAPMIARTDASLAAIVLMAGPAYTGRAIIDYQIRNGIEGDTSIAVAARDSLIAATRAGFDSSAARQPWMRFFLDYDPIPTAKAVRQPVLIVQGATDQQVRAEEATLLARALADGGNRAVTVKVMPDRNHLFLRDPVGHPSGYAKLTQDRVDGEVLGIIADWLTTTLRAPAWAAALDSAVTAELARTRTPGAQVAVVVDGRLAYTRGYGVADIETGRAVTGRTLFRVGSVTKMFTAATLGELVAAGKLDLQAPIATYVTELAGRRVGTVTTQQLLTHSAGWLDNAVAYGRMGEGALGEVMREVSDTLFFTAPGAVISYSNPGYSMAGYVAERAGGQRFAALVDAHLLRKMGMPGATFRPLEAMTRDFSQGHVGAPGLPGAIVRPFTENTAQWAAGFLFASAGEVARFTITMMDGGMLDGQRVLDAGTITRMTTGQMAIPGNMTARYGHGLRVETRDGMRIWQHGGAINGFDAQVTMYPDRKVAVIVFDNRGGAPLQGLGDLVARLTMGITPPAEPKAPEDRVGSPAERALVVGRYAMGSTKVEIAEENGALVFIQGERSPVRFVGEDRIVVTDSDGDRTLIQLVRGAGRRVEYLHLSLRALARQP